MTENNTEYLSINEAANILGIHPETLRRWDRTGKVISMRIGARGHRKYRRIDLESLTRNESKDFYRLHLQFQNYMLELGYEVKKREPLVSPVFPTTFTPSGGPDLVYDLANKHIIKNVVINQPCIRHWDIKLVGDSKHLSFFNMFVTASSSLSGFTRSKNISDYVNFLINYLHLDISRVYGSYCGRGVINGYDIEEDTEIKSIWKENGISEERQICFDQDLVKEAFVANSVEPYGGYRAELFYDTRIAAKPVSSRDEFVALEQSGVILEFFTHVKYWCLVENGKITKALDKNLIISASGSGPQRLLRILENVYDINDISVLKSIRQVFKNFKELENSDIDVLTDHIRAYTFLIGDNAVNLSGRKNKSRRTILNTYKKRIKERIQKLPSKSRLAILSSATHKVVDLFCVLFPVFEQKRNFIIREMVDSILVG